MKEPSRQPGLEEPASLREENSVRWAQHFLSPQSPSLFVTSTEQETRLQNRKLSRKQLLSKAPGSLKGPGKQKLEFRVERKAKT